MALAFWMTIVTIKVQPFDKDVLKWYSNTVISERIRHILHDVKIRMIA